MVHVDMIASAGAVLAGLAIKAPLAGAMNPVNHMRALATSSSAAECSAEGEACAVDGACLECADAYTGQTEPCAADLADDGLAVCDLVTELFCCATQGCWDNVAYAELLGCAQGVQEQTGIDCPVTDITTCTGGSDAVVPSDPDATDDDTSATAGDRGFPPADSTTTTVIGDTSGTFGGPGLTTTDSSTTPMDGTSATFGDPDVTATDGTDDVSGTVGDRDVSPVDSTTTSTTDTDTDGISTTTSACQAEGDACGADEECATCVETLSAAGDNGCESDDYDPETATCTVITEVACCQVEEGPDCIANNDAMAALIECLAEESGCPDFSVAGCTDGGSDGGDADGGDAGVSFPFLGGDDEAEGIEADEDEEGVDGDAAGTDTDSATPLGVVGGGTTAVFVAVAVSLAFFANA